MLGGETDAARSILWVLVVFVSVLAHELGHAFAGRAFGLEPQIELHFMGGTTSWSGGRHVGWVRSVAISLAGPFAGFAVGACVFGLTRAGVGSRHELVAHALGVLVRVNIVWGIVNLLPMLPLDGGNVMRAVLDGITRGKGERIARFISVAIAAVVAAVAFVERWQFLGVLAALFAFMNIQAIRLSSQRRVDAPLAAALEQAYAALDRHEGAQAIAHLRPVLSPLASSELRRLGTRVFAYALLVEGCWAELLAVLARDRELIGGEEMARYARTARELGREDDAARIDEWTAGLAPARAR